MTHTLHLTAVRPEQRAIAMRAVKLLLMAAGYSRDKAMAEAERKVYAVLGNNWPQGLVALENEAVIDSALAAFDRAVEGYEGAAIVVKNMDPVRQETAGGLADDAAPSVNTSDAALAERFMEVAQRGAAAWEPSREAATTALVLMAAFNGQAQEVWVYSKLLARSTGDHDLYVEVARLIGDAFTFEKAA